MEARYRFKVSAACPVDSLRDFYDFEVVSSQTIMIERFHEFAQEAATMKATQEDVTRKCFGAFPEAVEVISRGEHPRVAVECRFSREEEL